MQFYEFTTILWEIFARQTWNQSDLGLSGNDGNIARSQQWYLYAWGF